MTIETDINVMEYAGRTWRFTLKNESGEVLPPDGFVIYGAADCPGHVRRIFPVAMTGGVATVRMPGLPVCDWPWKYQIFAQEVGSGVEWLLCCGAVNVVPRVACGPVALSPELEEYAVVLDSTTHDATIVLGDSTAATAEAARQAEAAREGAEAAAKRVAADVVQVEDLKRVTLDAFAGAALSAERAEDAKRGAEAAAVDAAADAQLAEVAAAEAEASREAAEADAKLAGARAAEADASAKVATEAVSDALGARDEAAAARGGAEDAMRVAGARAGEAEGSAEAAEAARAGAEAAQAEAEAARVKAERSADEAEQNAALLGDAALRGADNVFSGVNSFVGGLLVENNLPLLWMLAGAYRVPLAAALAETEEEYIALAPAVVKGEDWYVFAPRLSKMVHQTCFTSFDGRCFAVAPNLMNPTFAKEISVVAFAERQHCVINSYRCNVVSVFYTGKKPLTVVNYGHNLFSQAPNVYIDAPYMTGTEYGFVVYGLKTIGELRVRMPRMQTSFTLKCGAVKRADLLYMLENMPDLRGVKKCTANLSCDPALEGDEDFLAAVAAFYDAGSGTGWDVGLTFQQNERFNEEAAQVATYGLRRPRAVPVYAKLVPSEGGAWVDAAGARWDLMTAHWVADESDWRLFADEAAAVEEWGLTELTMEEAANETLTETE